MQNFGGGGVGANKVYLLWEMYKWQKLALCIITGFKDVEIDGTNRPLWLMLEELIK